MYILKMWCMWFCNLKISKPIGVVPSATDETVTSQAKEEEVENAKKLSKRERKEQRKQSSHKSEKKDRRLEVVGEAEPEVKPKKKRKRKREESDEEEEEGEGKCCLRDVTSFALVFCVFIIAALIKRVFNPNLFCFPLYPKICA